MPLISGISARSAGTPRPDSAIAATRPQVLIDTVLPPVLGPVITSARTLPPSARLIGTALAPRRGCRALTSRNSKPFEIASVPQPMRLASWPQAKA